MLNAEKIKYCNIDKWHAAGYTGKGVKVAIFESGTEHGVKSPDILKQIAPGATIMVRPRPGGIILGSPEYVAKTKAFYRSLVDEGVNIITMSLTGIPEDYGHLQHDILKDITMLMAAGNRGGKGLAPEARFPNWISVGACILKDGKPVRVDYSGVGEQLDTCGFTNLDLATGGFFSGTSAANPFTTGMVACWFQWFFEAYMRYPTPQETLDYIAKQSEDLEVPGHDPNTGYGLFVLPEKIPKVEVVEVEKPDLIIDPGHGGTDPGAVGLFPEEDWTMQVSLYQHKRFNNDLGVKTDLTRSADVTLPLADRAAKVKASGAKYCISNHVNAGGGRGAEVWASIHSDRRWGGLVETELVADGMANRGVKSRESTKYPGHDYYDMHNLTGSVETIIVEYGFVDSADAAKLAKNWITYAEATIKATCAYMGVKYVPPAAADPLADAIKVLQSAGILNSPDYWLQNARPGKQCNGEYAGFLIQRLAEALKK